MCEINPKHAKYFKLEIFTSADITNEQWQQYVLNALLELEQSLNAKGHIRVHIHETCND